MYQTGLDQYIGWDANQRVELREDGLKNFAFLSKASKARFILRFDNIWRRSFRLLAAQQSRPGFLLLLSAGTALTFLSATIPLHLDPEQPQEKPKNCIIVPQH